MTQQLPTVLCSICGAFVGNPDEHARDHESKGEPYTFTWPYGAPDATPPVPQDVPE